MYFVPIIRLKTYDGREIVRLRDDVSREPSELDGPFPCDTPKAKFAFGVWREFARHPDRYVFTGR